MKHTYLFQEAIWQAVGLYINGKGGVIEVQGKSVVTHRSNSWRNECLMLLKADNTIEYRTSDYRISYEIEPFEETKDVSHWVASNSAVGKLYGHFVIVDDTILSLFQTRTGNVKGMEYLRKINDSQYQSKGTLFEEAQKISSWTIDLKRQLSAI